MAGAACRANVTARGPPGSRGAASTVYCALPRSGPQALRRTPSRSTRWLNPLPQATPHAMTRRPGPANAPVVR
jgi:hypothetical protein